MAKLDPQSYPLPRLGTFNNIEGDAHSAEFKRLRDAARQLPDGEIVGALLSWPVADGFAYYRVTSASPLTVQHVPYLDAWSVDPILIAGLTAADVRDIQRRERKLEELRGWR